MLSIFKKYLRPCMPGGKPPDIESVCYPPPNRYERDDAIKSIEHIRSHAITA